MDISKQNREREYLIKKHLSPSEISTEDLEIAYAELCNHKLGIDGLLDKVYSSLIKLGEPQQSVIRSLRRLGLSNMAATYLIRIFNEDVANNINVRDEFNRNYSTLSVCCNNLLLSIQEACEDGGEEYDTVQMYDMLLKFAKERNNMIMHSDKCLIAKEGNDIATRKVDVISKLSDEELMAKLKLLEDIEKEENKQ